MTTIEDLFDLEDPILTRAGEAITIMYVKCKWAAHELMSYTQTEDIADLMAVERILEEIKGEISHAQRSIATEINREDAKISEKSVTGDQEIHP